MGRGLGSAGEVLRLLPAGHCIDGDGEVLRLVIGVAKQHLPHFIVFLVGSRNLHAIQPALEAALAGNSVRLEQRLLLCLLLLFRSDVLLCL